MALRDEISRILTFEATGSKLIQDALQGPVNINQDDLRPVLIAALSLIRGINEALVRLADEIDTLRDEGESAA